MERPLAETHPRRLAIGQCDPLGTPPISAPMGGSFGSQFGSQIDTDSAQYEPPPISTNRHESP